MSEFVRIVGGVGRGGYTVDPVNGPGQSHDVDLTILASMNRETATRNAYRVERKHADDLVIFAPLVDLPAKFFRQPAGQIVHIDFLLLRADGLARQTAGIGI